jgi:hypothetical protein
MLEIAQSSGRLFDTGKAQRCFASSTAVLHALSQYGHAVLDRGEINEGGPHEEARIVSIS